MKFKKEGYDEINEKCWCFWMCVLKLDKCCLNKYFEDFEIIYIYDCDVMEEDCELFEDLEFNIDI